VIDDLTGASNLVASDDLGADLSDGEQAPAESSEVSPTNRRARTRRTSTATRKRSRSR